ncbi:hypothetical protein COB28_02505 [Candidatus Dependentiae bacterium]|nr:MAG: hypothetical protein COB28_02505 [Candidatus Dependentiae bacterium]
MKFLYHFSICILLIYTAGCNKQSRKKTDHTQQKHHVTLPPPPDLLPVRKYDHPEYQHEEENSNVIIESGLKKTARPHVRSRRVSSVTATQRSDVAIEALRVQSPSEEKLPLINAQDEMSVSCVNKTDKPITLCCFYYTKLRTHAYWRWVKSPSFSLDPHQICTIPIKAADDIMTKENIYGYLGIFDSPEKINNATYENLPDDQKIDLDRLLELKNSSIEIVVDQYGFKKEQLDYRIKKDHPENIIQPELDFIVENQTGKSVFIACFVYQKTTDQDSLVSWKYDKTAIHKLEPGQSTIIDIETIKELYDWIYMRGFLAVFDANQEEEAYESTYELLKPEQKIRLGRLADVLDKKIILTVERYGPAKKIFEFQKVPTKRIDFKKAYKARTLF